MRVRHLQTFLADQRLLRTGSLNDLEDMRIGIDAVYWMRTLSGLKDPLADAIGGMPPAVPSILDFQMNLFKKSGIKPVFVFQGMQPRSHSLFSSQLHQQMDEAWRNIAAGARDAAQLKFAQATSRINSDFLWFIFHYLKYLGAEVFQAPHFAAAQIASFAKNQCFEAVLGHPALLLFGVPRVIVSFDFQKRTFEWVELSLILRAWKITRSQFVNACLLAGTEHCLTFPYLNLLQFHAGQSHFTFGTAVEFIKQADMISYMMHFPNEDMKNDHVEGYCVCKSLIEHPLVMHTSNGSVGPLKYTGGDNTAQLSSEASLSPGGASDATPPLSLPSVSQFDTPGEGSASNLERTDSPIRVNSSDDTGEHESLANQTPQMDFVNGDTSSLSDGADRLLPNDFKRIVGLKLPPHVYLLMAQGFLSRKLPAVLSLGEWLDYSHPTVDSVEYRDLLNDITSYRCRALGLIAVNLHPEFREKQISFSRYNCGAYNAQAPHTELSRMAPNVDPGLPWQFTAQDILADMQRQNTTTLDLKFCLCWHAHVQENKGSLLGSEPIRTFDDSTVIFALVHFMLLENLGFFTENGGVTVFESALLQTPSDLLEDALLVLELMKFGVLSGEAFEPPKDRPFSDICLLRHEHSANERRALLLLTRILSLRAAELEPMELWRAEVDFDLAAFHSIVRMLKRSLRQLTEASLASILLPRLEIVRLLPRDVMYPLAPKVPCFVPPRNCMGIVAKFLLEYNCQTDGQQAASSADGSSNSNVDPKSQNRKSKGSESCADSKVEPHMPQWRKLEQDTKQRFPCCISPIEDFIRALRFWTEILRIVLTLGTQIEDVPLKAQMELADVLLWDTVRDLGIHEHPKWNALFGAPPPR